MHASTEYKNIREVLQLLVRQFGLLQKDSAQCCGITVLQSHILYEVRKHAKLSLNGLSEALRVDTSTLSRQVQQLVEKGMLTRTTDAADRRYVALSLTPSGEQKALEISGAMQEYIAEVFRFVPELKQDQVVEGLKVLSDAMRNVPNGCVSTKLE